MPLTARYQKRVILQELRLDGKDAFWNLLHMNTETFDSLNFTCLFILLTTFGLIAFSPGSGSAFPLSTIASDLHLVELDAEGNLIDE